MQPSRRYDVVRSLASNNVSLVLLRRVKLAEEKTNKNNVKTE